LKKKKYDNKKTGFLRLANTIFSFLD